MQKMKVLMLIIITLFLFSCKKEIINDKYVIFSSDSSNVVGVIGSSTILYQNVAYKVTQGQTILFEKPQYGWFHLNIEVGPRNYYSPDNFRYTFDNQYILTI